MKIEKTFCHRGMTLAHGCFQVREVVHVCAHDCRPGGQRVRRRQAGLADILLPRSTVGYDVMTFVGLNRFVHHRQREEIRTALRERYNIVVSSGEVSTLAQRFLVYLETLHELCAPRLRKVMERDGGYPLHIDATGESGRGTLLVALAGWRGWVLGSWKLDTERADAILPRLRATVAHFGAPCAVMRDLGRAVIEAAAGLVEKLGGHVPVLGCHFHFLRDVGKDLLTESHDQLRGLFRRFKIRPGLRTIARDVNRQLGPGIEAARGKVEDWLADPSTAAGHQLPGSTTGLAVVRAIAQWVLNYPADGHDEGFPFDLPYLAFHRRCSRALRAAEAFLRSSHSDHKVQRLLERLHRTLQPVRGELPFSRTTLVLERRARLFTELRQALRLRTKPDAILPSPHASPEDLAELQDIKKSVKKLTTSLRRRRPERGPAQDTREAIDVVLAHLERHGPSLFGQIVPLPEAAGGGARLVDRTNLALEGFFGAMMHAERRRSGRKNLGQDLEHLPGGAPLAHNLTCADYVEIVCGSLDDLPRAFAELDAADRRFALPVRNRAAPREQSDVLGSSLPRADRAIVRSEKLEERIRTAACSRPPRRQPTRNRALAGAR